MVGSLSAAGLACAARYDRLCEGGPVLLPCRVMMRILQIFCNAMHEMC